MTVAELIEKLSQFPGDSEVTLWCDFMQDVGLTVDGVDVMEA